MGETLPAIATRIGASLDAIRALVRTRPELTGLGQRYGPTRVFAPAEALLIENAYRARRSKSPSRAMRGERAEPEVGVVESGRGPCGAK